MDTFVALAPLATLRYAKDALKLMSYGSKPITVRVNLGFQSKFCKNLKKDSGLG